MQRLYGVFLVKMRGAERIKEISQQFIGEVGHFSGDVISFQGELNYSFFPHSNLAAEFKGLEKILV